MTGTFIDTIVICSMTGLVLIVTGAWNSGAEVSVMTKAAFDSGLPGTWGGFIVSFGIVFCPTPPSSAGPTMVKNALEYLGRAAVLPITLIYLGLRLRGRLRQTRSGLELR